MIAAAAAAVIAVTVPAAASDLSTDYFSDGTSARSFGMGNAFAAAAEGVDSLYWNPAGLGLLTRNTFSTTRSEQDFFDLTTQSLSYAQPTGRGAAGFHLVYSSIGTGTACAEADPRNEGCTPVTIGEDDTAFSFSYGMKYRKNLLIGASLKSVRRKLTPAGTDSGWGFDVGAMMDVGRDIRGGLVIQNIGGLGLGDEDEVPMNIRFGLAGKVPSMPKLMLAASYESAYMNKSVMNLGAEYALSDTVALRLGSSDGNFAAGLGVTYESVQLDYAFNKDDVLGDQSKLTLGYVYREQKKKAPKAETTTAAPPERRKPPVKEAAKEEKPAAAATAEETKPAEEKSAGRGKKKTTEETPAEEKPAAAETKPAAEEKPAAASAEKIDRKRGVSESLNEEKKPAAESKPATEVKAKKAETKAAVGDTVAEGAGAYVGGGKSSLPSFEELTGGTATAVEEEPVKTTVEPRRSAPPIGEGTFGLDGE